MKKYSNYFTFIFLALLALFLTGCGGLPKEVKEKAKAVPDYIKAGRAAVDKNKAAYESLTKTAEFSNFAGYAQKEQWTSKFDNAHKELDRANELYSSTLKPLLKTNKEELSLQVMQEIGRIKRIANDAKKLSKYPVERYNLLNKAVKDATLIHKKALSRVVRIENIVKKLNTDFTTKAKKDFPGVKDKVDAKYAPFLKIERDVLNQQEIVKQQYQIHQSGSGADYALFQDNADLIQQNLATTQKLEKQFKKEVHQLYKSYTKILKDMKTEFYLTVARESWDNDSDYNTSKIVKFTRQVSPEVYDAFNASPVETIAEIRYYQSFSSPMRNEWNQLKIKPMANWPYGHDAAVFWVDNSDEKYFHKYIMEENGNRKDTDWQQVKWGFYESSMGLLGMAVLTKPFGVFEEDRMTQASPPGMSYVGNPLYGEWQEDENGDRFWSWYGKYAFFSTLFFLPPTYYYYNSWRSWDMDYKYKKAYFGKTKKGRKKYGTYGAYVGRSPGFQNSRFARSGGLKTQAASVRGAGAKMRGGGPKAKGK